MMTEYMNVLVENHLPCVKEVISQRIHIPNEVMLEYDDIYQVGCEALCIAATKYDPNKGDFAAFASTVIYNAILSYCEKMYRRSKGRSSIDLDSDNDSFAMLVECPQAGRAFQEVEDQHVLAAFHSCLSRYSGVTRRGIEAIELKLLGVSTSEIAARYKTDVKNVNAWISRARSKLKQDEMFLSILR